MIILGVWALTPYIFATISSFILATDYRRELMIFKKEAIIDWIVRVLSCIVVFQEFNFGFMSNEYIIQQVIVAVLFVINLALEFKMYNKAKSHVYCNNEINKEEKISENEKQNIKNMGKATTLGVTSLFIVGAISMSVTSTTHIGGGLLSKLIAIIASVCVFVWFLNINLRKCLLFYLDKDLAKRTFIRDGIYATIGYVLCLLVAFEVFGTSELLFSLTTIIGVLSLYPTITTNRKMGLRYKKVVEILGENFELYFTCNDKK